MISLVLLAALAQAPDAGRPGENDAPVLIDLAGHQTPLDGGSLPLGTACLTYDKAASVRDDLAAKNARVATLEAGSGIDWPLTLGLIGGGTALGVIVGAIAGFVAGQAAHH